MPNNWKTYKLGDVTSWKSGGTPSKAKPEFWNGDIPWISAKTLKGRYVFDSDLKITKRALTKGGKLASIGSLLFLVRGSGLYNDIPVAMVTKEVAYNQDIKCVLPTNENLTKRFLLYWFKGNKSTFTNMLEATSIGAGKFDTERLHKLEINIPPLPEQTQIANILSAIDDKIENNLATNKTLEDMAMALYKHWFVDFGPFQDGEFIDSELGLIPKGWEEKKLDDLACILNSKRVPLSTGQRSKRKGEYPYYGASGVIDNIDDFIFDGEYVIISEDGENLRSRKTPIGFSAIGKFWVNNHAHILEGKQNGINKLIICHIAQMDMNPYLTGAVQPKLNKSNLLSIGIAMPKEDSIIQEVLGEFYSISRLIFSNEKENQSLTELRDTLLPKLISGEVRLKEFRAQVEHLV